MHNWNPRTSFVFTLLVLVFCRADGQRSSRDSLELLLRNESAGPEKVDHLLMLIALDNLEGTDSSLIYCYEALQMAQDVGYNRGIGLAQNAIAEQLYEKSDYEASLKAVDTALNYWDALLASSASSHEDLMQIKKCRTDVISTKCLVLLSKGEANIATSVGTSNLQTVLELGYQAGEAKMYNVLGTAYLFRGEFAQALEYLFKALRKSEDLGDQKQIALNLNCIGSVYAEERKPQPALEYYQRSLDIGKQSGDRRRVAIQIGQIGTAYFDMGNFSEALKYQFDALKASKEINDSDGEVCALANIANCYFNLNQPEKVVEYYSKTIARQTELGNRRGVAIALFNLGIYYSVAKEYKNAEQFLLKSLALSDSLEYYEQSLSCCFYLTDLYRGTNRNEEALKYMDRTMALKDQLFSIEKDKAITEKELTFEFEKREATTKAEQEKRDLQIQDRLKREKIIRYSTISGLAIVLIFAAVVFRQKKKITLERDRSDELLLNILPSETAEELKTTGAAKTKSYSMVTVLFTDFKNFTRASELMSAEELVHEINYCYSEFDKIITRYGIEKIKTIGDSYMCAGGLPMENETHALDTVKAALEIQQFMYRYKVEKDNTNTPCFELRLGIHTGPVVAGIVGIKKFAYDIWGDTVNIASRMESSGEVGKVNISETTYQLVKDQFICIHRGKIDAKNKGEVDMYFVEGVA